MTSVVDKPKRRRLDHERVLAAAEAVVDRDGWQDLTMTGLAAEVGVKVPSLYNHVPNLDALRGELQIRTMAALGAELQRAVMGKSEAKGFVALADVFRDFARRYPHRYDGATRAPGDPDGFFTASLDSSGAVAAVVASYGIPTDEILDLQLAAFSILHGVVVLENSGFFRGDLIDADRIYGLALKQALGLIENARRDTTIDTSVDPTRTATTMGSNPR